VDRYVRRWTGNNAACICVEKQTEDRIQELVKKGKFTANYETPHILTLRLKFAGDQVKLNSEMEATDGADKTESLRRSGKLRRKKLSRYR
jgi:hypothetical protein